MAIKTTIYLSEEMKRGIEVEARRLGLSEAEVIRRAISRAVSKERPRGGLYEADPIAERVDDLMAGFGER